MMVTGSDWLKVKGKVHPNKKICWKFTHPSVHPRFRWVCFFIVTDLEKFSIASLVHHRILCSEWVPSEWESKQLMKPPQVIHTAPVHQLTSCESKRCVFVTSDQNPIHNNASYRVWNNMRMRKYWQNFFRSYFSMSWKVEKQRCLLICSSWDQFQAVVILLFNKLSSVPGWIPSCHVHAP